MISSKMKKIFSIVLLMLFMVNILPSTLVFADGPSGNCGENVTYSFDESTGELTISGNGEMENYLYSCGSCYANPWNSYKDKILSVIIKDNVTSVGEGAFSDCANLADVSFPDSVTEICNRAFSHCTGLKSVNMGNNMYSIGDYAFSCCTSLDKINPLNVKRIGAHAFTHCSSLGSVEMRNVNSIGDYAFSCCTSLYKVHYQGLEKPKGSRSVFNGCNKLDFITLSIPGIDITSFCGIKACDLDALKHYNYYACSHFDDRDYFEYMG